LLNLVVHVLQDSFMVRVRLRVRVRIRVKVWLGLRYGSGLE
jgi:hypothetical protein